MNQNMASSRDFYLGCEHQSVTGCNAKDDTGATCGETFSLEILKLFNELYADRLKRVNGNSEVAQQTLHWWIQDLTEQNTLLVDTVEKLEQEVIAHFNSMASTTQGEVSSKTISTQTESLSCSQCAIHTQTINDARTTSAQTENHSSEARTQTQSLPDPTPSWINHLKSLHISRPACTAETQTQQLFSPIIPHQSSLFLPVASSSNSAHLRPVPSTQFSITLTRSTQTNERSCSSMSRPTQTPTVYWVSRYVQTMNPPLTTEKSVQAADFASGRVGERELLLPMAVRYMGSRLRVDAHTQTSISVSVDAQTETGPDPVRTQLAEAMKQVQGLHLMLRDSHKASHDTQEALTLEVAQKHDQILALKREVQQLEERLLHADKQTHFKDDIIREMRKQLKMASSKLLFLNVVDQTENIEETRPNQPLVKPFRKKKVSSSRRKPKVFIPSNRETLKPSRKRSEPKLKVDESGDPRRKNSECLSVRERHRRYSRSKFTLGQPSVLELRILDCLREELTAMLQQR